MIVSKSVKVKLQGKGINHMKKLQKITLCLSVSTLSMTGCISVAAAENSGSNPAVVTTEETVQTTTELTGADESRTTIAEVAATDESTTMTEKVAATDAPSTTAAEVTTNHEDAADKQNKITKPKGSLLDLLDDLIDIGDKPQQPKDNEANSNIQIDNSGNSTVGESKIEVGIAASAEELPEVKVETSIEEEVIPYETVVRYDATIPSGVTQVLVQGANGSIQLKVERFVTKDGVQDERRTLNYYRAPISRVIVVGTKNSRDSWQDAIRKPPLSTSSSSQRRVASISVDSNAAFALTQAEVVASVPQRLALSTEQLERLASHKGELPKTGTRQQTLVPFISLGMMLLGGMFLKGRKIVRD